MTSLHILRESSRVGPERPGYRSVEPDAEVAETIAECRDIFGESTGRSDVDVRIERYGGPRTFYRVTCLLPPAERSTCICTNPVVAVRAAFADLARR